MGSMGFDEPLDAAPGWTVHVELARQLQEENRALQQQVVALQEAQRSFPDVVAGFEERIAAANRRTVAAVADATAHRERVEELEAEVVQLQLDLGAARRAAAEASAAAARREVDAEEAHRAEVKLFQSRLTDAANDGRSMQWNLRDMQARAQATEMALGHAQQLLGSGDWEADAHLRQVVKVLRVAEEEFRELRADGGERSQRLAAFRAACGWCSEQLLHHATLPYDRRAGPDAPPGWQRARNAEATVPVMSTAP
eukprot:TRINITY_DN11902_c0_g2_i1.p1 TRINITY_DN11902_c0_g2~~TRINITY_DN11902_c0_g2_i1.p1  ORF type:complete len:255 (+),score=71.63 TRINITY_DN11902_c0_g2_i1:84-848(+)